MNIHTEEPDRPMEELDRLTEELAWLAEQRRKYFDLRDIPMPVIGTLPEQEQ